MYIPKVCKAYLHAKHAKTKGSGDHTIPKKVLNIWTSKIDFKNILTLHIKSNTDGDET